MYPERDPSVNAYSDALIEKAARVLCTAHNLDPEALVSGGYIDTFTAAERAAFLKGSHGAVPMSSKTAAQWQYVRQMAVEYLMQRTLADKMDALLREHENDNVKP